MYYFIGIKGTGMASLAIMLNDLGYKVCGSDLDKHFFTQDNLEKRNIEILSFNKDNIKDNMTVIIGNAFDEEFIEVKQARNNTTCKTYRYHEFVGEFMKNYKSISVCGSHGKTTTTGMLSSMLQSKYNTGYLIGDGTGYIDNKSELFVLESCEFRRHFLAYYPDYAIITNIEIDHVDYFKDEKDYLNAYIEFSNNVKKALFVFGDDEKTRQFKTNKKHYFYGLNDNNDLIAKNLIEYSDHMEFDVYFLDKFYGHYDLPFVGSHMLFNALGCIGIGILMDMDYKDIQEGLHDFKGVKRRYVVSEYKDNIFVDDYAHHPTEIAVTINATKKRYPNKEIVAIFKPHRVGRVYYFKEQFAKALSLADHVYLCDFTSIDDKEEGIDIDINYLKDEIKNSYVLSEDEQGAKLLAQYHNVVYLFMSSKDIYHLADLVKKQQ